MLISDENIPVITIDGPTGSGKGTISQLIAQYFGWHLLDSGAIYRVFALATFDQQICASDSASLATLANELHIEFIYRTKETHGVLLGGRDVTEAIRQEHIGSQASRVSQYPEVREALLNCQRAFLTAPGLVADGRDMGTVVFPDADLKIFLYATAEERAKRRYDQLMVKGIAANYDAILNDLIERDHRDQSREVAPLRPAEDAELIDSTHLSIDAVVQRIVDLAKQRELCS